MSWAEDVAIDPFELSLKPLISLSGNPNSDVRLYRSEEVSDICIRDSIVHIFSSKIARAVARRRLLSSLLVVVFFQAQKSSIACSSSVRIAIGLDH